MDERITINMKEAAKIAGVSVPVMRTLAHRPGFPAIRAGKRWLIPRDLFKKWLEEEAQKGA